MTVGGCVLLLRKQGLRHTPQMHRSLKAYRATLGTPQFRRSRFRHHVPPHVYTTRETPSSERRNSMGKKCPEILPKCRLPRYILGIFYMLQICDMGPTALLPLRRKAC